MNALARFVLHHRRWVMVAWFVIFVIGAMSAGKATERLTVDFSLPGQPGYETSQQILAEYGSDAGYQPYIPVVTVPEGTTVKDQQAKIDAVFAEIQAVPGYRVADFANTQDAVFVTSDERTTYALVYSPPPLSFTEPTPDKVIQPILDAATASTGFDWGADRLPAAGGRRGRDNGGPSVLGRDAARRARRPGGARVRLRLVAGPRPAADRRRVHPHDVPHRAAADVRHRRELHRPVPHRPRRPRCRDRLLLAPRLPMARGDATRAGQRGRRARRDATAGHAPSSRAPCTVAISLIALVVIPVPLLRSMGFGGMLIPLVSVIVVLTLLPAMLGGDRAARRLAADPPREQGLPRLDRVGAADRPAPLARRGAALVMLGDAHRAGLRHQDRAGPDRVPGQRRAGLQGAADLESTVVSGTAWSRRSRCSSRATRSRRAPTRSSTAALTVDGVSAAFAPDAAGLADGRQRAIDVIPTDETVDSDERQGGRRRRATRSRTLPGYIGTAGAGRDHRRLPARGLRQVPATSSP